MNGYVVARYIENVSLNGLEYLLDATGNEMVFETKELAQDFLKANGYSDEDMEGLIFKEW